MFKQILADLFRRIRKGHLTNRTSFIEMSIEMHGTERLRQGLDNSQFSGGFFLQDVAF